MKNYLSGGQSLIQKIKLLKAPRIKLPEFGTGALVVYFTTGFMAMSVIVGIITDPINIFGFTLSFAWLVFFAGMAYILLSFDWSDPINADELAVRDFFGKPVDILYSGLPFVPRPFFDLTRLNALFIQREFPDEPENIWDGDEDKVPPGKKPPIRITFRDSIEEGEIDRILGGMAKIVELHKLNPDFMSGKKEWADYKDHDFDKLEEDTTGNVPCVEFKPNVPADGLGRRVTVKVIPVIRWRIKDAITFVKNIGSETEANKQIEDEMVSTLQRMLPNISLAQAMQNLPWVSAHLHSRVIRRTRNWGIQIEGAYIKQLPLHYNLNQAISELARAEFTGRTDRELAIKKGEGAAVAARALEEQTLKGRAVGLKAITDELKVDGASVQAAEVARSLADGGNTVVVGASGFKEIIGVVKAMTDKN